MRYLPNSRRRSRGADEYGARLGVGVTVGARTSGKCGCRARVLGDAVCASSGRRMASAHPGSDHSPRGVLESRLPCTGHCKNVEPVLTYWAKSAPRYGTDRRRSFAHTAHNDGRCRVAAPACGTTANTTGVAQVYAGNCQGDRTIGRKLRRCGFRPSCVPHVHRSVVVVGSWHTKPDAERLGMRYTWSCSHYVGGCASENLQEAWAGGIGYRSLEHQMARVAVAA